MNLTRRGFIQAVAATTAGSVAFTGCTAPGSLDEFRIESSVLLPEDLVANQDTWYASACQGCSAGCGLIVRVMAGRTLKLEGNPDFPVNLGRLSARGQAGVQEVYHPDRVAGPLLRSGPRFTGDFQGTSWDGGIDILVGKLRDLVGKNEGKQILVITRPTRSHRQLVLERFAQGLGAQVAYFDGLDRRGPLREALKRVFGFDQLPEFDIAKAKYVLSFGADFLGTWLSPVHYGRQYGEFRRGPNRERGKLVQIEPRMSQTGMAADEWIPIRPGTEGILALALAQALGGGAAGAPTPEQAAQLTGVPVEKIQQIARELKDNQPALVLGGDSPAGHTNGLFNLTAIYSLNQLVGATGAQGTIRPNPASPFPDLASPARRTSYVDWQRLEESMRNGGVQVVLADGANPAYGLPGFADALQKVPYVVSLSSFRDETTELADLILPGHHYLEDWGTSIPDPLPGVAAVAFQQPLTTPQLNTRSAPDVLLQVAGQLEGSVKAALPWTSFRAVVEEAAQQLAGRPNGSVTPARPGPEYYWVKLLQQGGWWGTQAGQTTAALTARPSLPAQPPAPSFAGGVAEFPYHLHVYSSPAILEGELAHLPWLQGMPDPTTTAVWGTWVEINPDTAAKLGVAEGDYVSVASPTGSVEVPVYVYPGTRPDVVAMPLGQGHTASGRWAKDRGVNPLTIIAPQTDAETGSLAYEGTRVKLTKVGRSRRLPKFEGVVQPFRPEELPLVLGSEGETTGGGH